MTVKILLSTGSVIIGILGLITLGSYVVLAKAFWFKIPFAGITIATILFLVAYLIAFS